MAETPTIIIVPGNYCNDIFSGNWYGWLYTCLTEKNVSVKMETMPDPELARETIWLPKIEQMAGGVENLANCIVVGHSSGAVAAMRLAEKCKLKGIVIVSGYTSDLGDEDEKASGYFNRPWEWEKMKQNCDFIAQFASQDDPFLPIDDQRSIKKNLGEACDYHEFENKSHFFDTQQQELLQVVLKLCGLGCKGQD